MSFRRIAPTQINTEITGDSTWTLVDLASYGITTSDKLVRVRIVGKSSAGFNFGLRKPGSTDNFHPSISNNRQREMWVGVDGGEVEYYSSEDAASVDVYITGADDTAELWVPANLVSIGPLSTSAFTDMDLTAARETAQGVGSGAGTPCVAACVYTNGSYMFGARKNGSTDDLRQDDATQAHWEMVGMDGSEIIEARDGTGATLYAVAFWAAGVVMHTNRIDRSTGSATSYQDVTMSSDVVATIYNARTSEGDSVTLALRDKLDTTFEAYAPLESGNAGQFIVTGDVQQKISATSMDIFERGYFEAVDVGISGDLDATESGSDTLAATGGVGSAGVRLTLRDTDTGALAADLTGLIISIRAASNSGSVLAGSASESTDGDGVLEFASLAIGDPGDYVYVTVEKSDNSIVATYRVQVVDLNA